MSALDSLSLWQAIAWMLYLGLMGFVIYRLPLGALLQDKQSQHLVFGSAASMFVLWLFRAGIHDGLNVHFLWLTALTLLLGLRRALFSAMLALIGITAVGKESWALFGINGLLGVMLPVVLSYLIYNLSFHRLPRHFLVYVFVCAFLPGALMIALKMAAIGFYYNLDGLYDWQTVMDNYLVLIPLLLFPEAMLNGMTMTLLIIYRPAWVYTFYDKFYFKDE
ncbi:energy-coupling factor ABC transporter permease [Aliiglaciecola sp. CAU 1673]|uniref:energy-coupling factor ABC transporter permease n=1 Tax=Aliiglaciecola sp. CAU 1673 TaxID=3032595 RepID=UPI0023D99543|nr:energy-coupling factor ABC transporter permease [Aliiglaciecola sp. CAU 1673]MDF2179818.1 energy-coupling factor ABC transporter permease [Aliiglaciecola sp. CAU 1673]